MNSSHRKNLEHPICVCGSSELCDAVHKCKDELSGTLFDFVQCASCGTERVAHPPSPQQIGAYYPSEYACHRVRGDSSGERIRHLIYLAFYCPENRLGAWRWPLKVLLYPLRGFCIMAFVSSSTRRVFEFGAASANDLLLFKAEGWAVDGCEPSAAACATAATRGVLLRNCAAEEVTLESGSVSAVVMNNVLEHLHDPVGVLTSSFRALVPEGALVLVVPNHASWSARLFGPAWPGYDAPRHLWGFTPHSLDAVLRRIGFDEVRIHHLFQGRWAWRSTIDGRHRAKPVSRVRKAAAGPLSLLLMPLGWLAAACGRGDFMTVVARRPPNPVPSGRRGP
jgi:SAM-dependent methyltransferase